MTADIATAMTAWINRLKAARHAAVFTHIRPDADALGSQVALCRLLTGLGKKVVLVSLSAVPAPLKFLLADGGFGLADYTPEWGRANLPQMDSIAVVDTSAPMQLEPAADLLRTMAEKIIILDHHLTGDLPHAILVRNTDVPACVEMVADVYRRMNVPLDPPTAVALLAGLVADTGWFRFDSVRASTHRLAAELIEAGASPSDVYALTAQQESRSKLDLMKRALEHLQWFSAGKLAMTYILKSDMAECHAQPWQTEGLVDMPLSVGEVEVSACLSEADDNKFRASLRSKGRVDVNAVCAAFGGGGHARAAGCRLSGPVDAAVRRLVDAIESRI